jgi:hypothetical protein
MIALAFVGPLVLLATYATLYWIFRNDSPEGD